MTLEGSTGAFNCVDYKTGWHLALLKADAVMAALQMVRVFEWPEANGREDRFVNFYDNTNDATGEGQLVVILSDRDTAIMLKLALG